MAKRLQESGFPVQKARIGSHQQPWTDSTANMQIVYHLGAHATDDDRLVRALLKNRGTLEAAVQRALS